MLAAQFGDITEAHLKALVTNKTPESQMLDFKRDVPGRDAKGRHDICADVCAFANGSGGDLVYGVDEDAEGRAAAIAPSTSNPDDEQLRLQDVILNGLEPRVTGVQVRAVPVAGGHAFVVRVPRSWTGPHRVKTNQHFYLREGARQRQLDMPEIRSAFARSQGLTHSLQEFRADRVSKILAGNAPVPLPQVPICVMHLIPIQPSEGALPINPKPRDTDWQLPLIYGHGSYYRPNLDGSLRYSMVDQVSNAYTQFFRNGTVEAVWAFMSKLENNLFNIPSSSYERELIKFYDALTPELVKLKLAPPLLIFFSLLRASLAHFGVGQMEAFFDTGSHGFDRDVLLYPDIVVEENSPGRVALRPVFDLVWQSVGYEASRNFDANGNWVERR